MSLLHVVSNALHTRASPPLLLTLEREQLENTTSHPSRAAQTHAYFKRHLSRVKPQNASAYIFFQVAPYCFNPEFFSRVFFNVDLGAKNRAGQTQKCHPFFQGVATAKFRPDLCLQRLRWLFFFFLQQRLRAPHTICAPRRLHLFFFFSDDACFTNSLHPDSPQMDSVVPSSFFTASRSRCSAAESGFNFRHRPRCQ